MLLALLIRMQNYSKHCEQIMMIKGLGIVS